MIHHPIFMVNATIYKYYKMNDINRPYVLEYMFDRLYNYTYYTE